MLHQSGEFNRVLERTEPGKQMSSALEHQWWISVGADRGGCWQLSGTVSSELITDYEGSECTLPRHCRPKSPSGCPFGTEWASEGIYSRPFAYTLGSVNFA